MFKIQSLWAHKQSTTPNLIKRIIYLNNLVAKLLEKDAIISKHLCNVQSIWLHKCRCLLCAIYRQLASPWWLIEWAKLEKHQNICFIFDQISCLYEPAAMELLQILSSTSPSRWSAESVSSKAWKCGCDTAQEENSLHLIVSRLSLLPWPSRLLAAGLSMALASPCLFSQPSN